ncbi:MAG: type II toxin-antitoxin system VapC family toxin [Spirochaetaceae bacterium]|jgi:PIN domain nuclease of toxin-antitoxin system|nr:type II toxin-antitoxin system VapC family toxin [Spirochaetaceae bacterium]
MTCVLDSRALLWSIGNSRALSQRASDVIKDSDNDILISAVSLWEIAVKVSQGTVLIGSLAVQDIPYYCKELGFTLIPLDPIDAIAGAELPRKAGHEESFERMLVYQCIRHAYTLVSPLKALSLYKDAGLKYLW